MSVVDNLWPFQQVDVERISKLFHDVRRVLYTLPTGGGKTHVAVALILAARQRGERVLFVAHRRELVNQAARRLVKAGVYSGDIGVIMGKDKRTSPTAPIQVASVDTLRRRDRPEADFVIIDEAHRARAESYKKILEWYPEAKVLGLTATPFRLDGKGLGTAFDEMVKGPSPEELITDGRLSAPRVFTVPDRLLPDLKGVKTVAGDYDQGELGKRMNRKVLVANVVDEYRRLGEGRAAVVFASGLEHARSIQAEFVAAGLASEYLDGGTAVEERDAMLDRLKTGVTKVAVSCDVLVEGWDAPWVKCAILARPTKSLGRFLQMVGRILRPWNGTIPLVLDHAGNAVIHGFPETDRREWFTLEDRSKRGGGMGVFPEAKRCPECGCTVSLGVRSCPVCGHLWLETVEGELVEAKGRPLCCVCGVREVSAGSRNRLRKTCGDENCLRKSHAEAIKKTASRYGVTSLGLLVSAEQHSKNSRRGAMNLHATMTAEQRQEHAERARKSMSSVQAARTP